MTSMNTTGLPSVDALQTLLTVLTSMHLQAYYPAIVTAAGLFTLFVGAFQHGVALKLIPVPTKESPKLWQFIFRILTVPTGNYGANSIVPYAQSILYAVNSAPGSTSQNVAKVFASLTQSGVQVNMNTKPPAAPTSSALLLVGLLLGTASLSACGLTTTPTSGSVGQSAIDTAWIGYDSAVTVEEAWLSQTVVPPQPADVKTVQHLREQAFQALTTYTTAYNAGGDLSVVQQAFNTALQALVQFVQTHQPPAKPAS